MDERGVSVIHAFGAQAQAVAVAHQGVGRWRAARRHPNLAHAQACRKSLVAPLTGAEVFVIAAADTCMNRTNAELMAAYFPAVTIAPDTGSHDTLLSIDKARRLLGYEPQHSWRS